MIQANELRIGNWVLGQTNKATRVDTFFNENKAILTYVKDDRVKFIIHCLNECNGIPLTEEILLKCRFENEVDEIDGKIHSIYFATNTDYLVEYSFYNKTYVFTDDMGLKVFIKYLHQLQNLYFALTGEELEINL